MTHILILVVLYFYHLRPSLLHVLTRWMSTQVEQSAKEPVGFADFMEAVFRWTDPVTGFIRFRPKPVKTGSWIRSPDPCTGFLAFSGWKRWVSWGFSPEIHGILLQESSFWVFCIFDQYNRTWKLRPKNRFILNLIYWRKNSLVSFHRKQVPRLYCDDLYFGWQ